MGEYWWWRASGSDSAELCSIWQHILKEKCAPGGRKAMSIGAAIFTAFVIFIHIFFMACASWCRNLRSSLQVFSCSGHVPDANYMEPSLLIGHNFGEKSLLTKTGILLWVNAFFFNPYGNPRWINMKALVAQETKCEEQHREQSKTTALPHSSISCKNRGLL